jgi:antitoxin component of RelBE/YafQ-DinJ toxin-antitoxin module
MLVEVEENVRLQAGHVLDGLGLTVPEAVSHFLEFLARERRCPSTPDLAKAGVRPAPPGCRRRVKAAAALELAESGSARRLFLVEPPEGMAAADWQELICRVNVPACGGRRV